ncbi:MAG: IS110 family transposase, partial [Acidobacteria bacterium]|nr:IS110 family transposase [Acidobacteriota bacterium]
MTELLDSYERVETAILRVEEKIGQEVEQAADPFVGEAVKLLDTIPGVGERVAETIVSEIGVEMERFPTDAHLSSWAGMCPGNNESAGKRKTGKTGKGNRYLRAALVQAAWAASHQKGTY